MAEAPAKAAPKAATSTTTVASSPPDSAPEAQRSPGKIIRKAPPGSRRARRAKQEKRKGPFVKYVGDASYRDISVADWGSIPGMKPKDEKAGYSKTVWDVHNDKMVELSVFSDEQLDYLLIDDLQPNTGVHSFLEVDYDEDGNIAQVVYEEDEDAEDEDDK